MAFRPPRPWVLLAAVTLLAFVAVASSAYLGPGQSVRAQEISEADRILVDDLLFRLQQHFIDAYFFVDASFLEPVVTEPELTRRSHDIFERYTKNGLYAEFRLERYRLLDVHFTSDIYGWAATQEEWSGVLRTTQGDVRVGDYFQAARHLYVLWWTDDAGWRIAEERVEDSVGGWRSGPLVPTPTATTTPTPTAAGPPPSPTSPPAAGVPTVVQPPSATPTRAATVPVAAPTSTPALAPSPTSTPTPAPTSTPTVAVTNTPTPSPTFVRGAFVITVFDGRSNPERVTIQNIESDERNLIGWRVVARRRDLSHTIPSITLRPGEQVTVVSGDAARPSEAGTDFWTNAFVFEDDTDTVFLYNPSGQLVDSKSY